MKKTISVLIIFVILLVMIPMTANALIVDDWEILITGNDATIIGYNGTCTEKMIMPIQVGNYKITTIKGKNIFDENVKEIVFPEGYISIEDGSYPGTFGSSKKSLEKVSLPNSLTKLDVSFNGFKQLKEINIPPQITEIKYNQFGGCVNLESIQLSEGLKRINSSAFSGSGLKDIVLPSTVTEIGDRAYAGCNNLVNVTIPDTVLVIGDGGYYYEGILMHCNNLETVVIGDGVTTLAKFEFWGCPKLKSVYLGNSITTIMGCGFQDCPSLKSLVLPNSIKTIDYDFCHECLELESVVFPKGINKITAYNATLKTTSGFNMGETQNPLPKLFLYGYSNGITDTFANNGGFPFVDISVATPTNSKVIINGKEVAFTAYNIGGNNYFKLRDIASAISGTNKNFNVGWDGSNKAISLTSKTAYTNIGGELVVNSNATVTEPKISNPKIFVDGTLTTFMAFNIADNNYIKLRDLGEVFDFGVDWNNFTQTIEINTNKGYTK